MRIDWNSITHFFQLPLSWFRDVDRRSHILGDGKVVQVDRNSQDGTIIKVDPKGLGVPSAEVGTLVDKTDTETDDDDDGDTWTWTAGGDDGLKMDAYFCIVEEQGWHYFQRVRLEISKDGLITKAEGLSGRREVKA